MDKREAHLRQWLVTTLSLPFSSLEETANNLVLTPLCGDASQRRYYRWQHAGQPYIAVDTPLDVSNYLGFSSLCKHWEAASIPVPELLAEDDAQGFMLLEDLGDETLLSALDDATASGFYASAIDHLLAIQQTTDPENYPLPDYDSSLLQREMALFDEWFLEKLLKLELTRAEKTLLQAAYNDLSNSALSQPKVVVHRDYHSRNLMVTRGAESSSDLAIIDFQDAVKGPVSYDVVSLLKDCYINWPALERDTWMNDYLSKAIEYGILTEAEKNDFPQWFDLMGAQRHLKAIGIFSRLHVRDDKSTYLADIPRTLNYLIELTTYEPMKPLIEFIQGRVIPAMKCSGLFQDLSSVDFSAGSDH